VDRSSDAVVNPNEANESSEEADSQADRKRADPRELGGYVRETLAAIHAKRASRDVK
jgi:hypothetical protein